MKTILILLSFAALVFSAIAASLNQKYEVSQAEIRAFSKTFSPNKYPLQIDCCYPNDKTSTTVGHGARCAVGGSQYCVENACPTGTVECGAKE